MHANKTSDLLVVCVLAALTLGCVTQQIGHKIGNRAASTSTAFDVQQQKLPPSGIPPSRIATAEATLPIESPKDEAQLHSDASQLHEAQSIDLDDSDRINMNQTFPILSGREPVRSRRLPTNTRSFSLTSGAIVEADPLSLSPADDSHSTAIAVTNPQGQNNSNFRVVDATPLALHVPTHPLPTDLEKLDQREESLVNRESPSKPSELSPLPAVVREEAAESVINLSSRNNNIVYQAAQPTWQEQPQQSAPSNMMQRSPKAAEPSLLAVVPESLHSSQLQENTLAKADRQDSSHKKLPRMSEQSSRIMENAANSATPSVVSDESHVVATLPNSTAPPYASEPLQSPAATSTSRLVSTGIARYHTPQPADIKASKPYPRSNRLQDRLERLSLGFQVQGMVRVILDNRVAILKGEVPAESDGRTLERLLRMEPGVDDVVNELRTSLSEANRVRTAATW